MQKDKQEAGIGLPEIGVSLDELVRRGARQVIQQVIELELAALLEQYANVRTLSGKKAVVRNGYLPERDVLTAAGPVAVKVPKVRDRSGTGVKFHSMVVPPYVRKSPRVSAALPWLYLKGVSTGDMSEALSVLLGDEAKGLSANVVSRLKAHWAEEWQQWDRRDLSTARYVYWWADGIHTGVKSEGANGQCASCAQFSPFQKSHQPSQLGTPARSASLHGYYHWFQWHAKAHHASSNLL